MERGRDHIGRNARRACGLPSGGPYTPQLATYPQHGERKGKKAGLNCVQAKDRWVRSLLRAPRASRSSNSERGRKTRDNSESQAVKRDCKRFFYLRPALERYIWRMLRPCFALCTCTAPEGYGPDVSAPSVRTWSGTGTGLRKIRALVLWIVLSAARRHPVFHLSSKW